MHRLFLIKRLFAFILLLYASGVLSKVGDVFYVLEAIKYEKHTAYDSDFNVSVNGLDWRVPGNQNFSDGWRIGGNELSKSDRTITGKSAIGMAIGKVTLHHGGVTSEKFTVHSISLTVASDANYSHPIATITKTFPSVSSAGSIDFEPSSGAVWPADSYYRLTIRCSNSATTNQGLIFKSLVFYEGMDEDAVPLPSPSNLSVSDVTHSSATLTWSPVEKAIGYKVRIGSSEHVVSTTTFFATDIESSTVYTWSVMALGDGTAYSSSEYAASETFMTTSVPTHTVKWSVNGHITTEQVAEGASIAFSAPTSDIPEGKTFVGWYVSPYEHSTIAPSYVHSATMGTSDVTYYAVFATKESTGETYELKAQTLQYDTWKYRGSTQDKDTYRLFHADGYVESEPFDLSLLTKVIVYGGTFNGASYNSLTIGDGTSIWKEVTVSGNDATKAHTYSGGTPLSGIGTLRVTSCSGKASSGAGIRISKIEIFIASDAIYSDFSTSPQSPSYTAGTLDFSAHNAEGYWATFSSDRVTFFPRGISPYIVSVEGSRMVLRGGDDVFGQATRVSISENEQTGYCVPANVGVLLNSSLRSAPYYTVTGRGVAPIEASDNLLRPGTGGETTGDGCKFYRLAYDDYAAQTGLGFYFGEGCFAGEAFICRAGLAYLAVPEEVSVKKFVFDTEESDGIDVPLQVRIKEAPLFNLSGQRLLRPQRGINVANGKKYVVE